MGIARRRSWWIIFSLGMLLGIVACSSDDDGSGNGNDAGKTDAGADSGKDGG